MIFIRSCFLLCFFFVRNHGADAPTASLAPIAMPTEAPTLEPTAPTESPTPKPTAPTSAPSSSCPSSKPSSSFPSSIPSSSYPSSIPSSSRPSYRPSSEPTSKPTPPIPFFDLYYGKIVKILLIVIPSIALLLYTSLKLWNHSIDRMEVSDGWKACNLDLLLSSNKLVEVEVKGQGISMKIIHKDYNGDPFEDDDLMSPVKDKDGKVIKIMKRRPANFSTGARRVNLKKNIGMGTKLTANALAKLPRADFVNVRKTKSSDGSIVDDIDGQRQWGKSLSEDEESQSFLLNDSSRMNRSSN